jgi:hypothetical protein
MLALERRVRMSARSGTAGVAAATLAIVAVAAAIAFADRPYAIEGVSPLAKFDGWREGSRDHNAPFARLEIAYDRATAERAWQENVPARLSRRSGMPEQAGLYGSMDDVDFESQAVVVWSGGQSGSCPGWLFDIRTTEGGVDVKTRFSAEVGSRIDLLVGDRSYCTADYAAYGMILAVARDRLPHPSDLPWEEPNPGATWPWLYVTEYPVTLHPLSPE